MLYIYPENWVEPEAPTPVTLTVAQLAALKTKMQKYVNNKDKPVLIKELVEDAYAYVLQQTGKHIAYDVFTDMAEEIQNEWHPEED